MATFIPRRESRIGGFGNCCCSKVLFGWFRNWCCCVDAISCCKIVFLPNAATTIVHSCECTSTGGIADAGLCGVVCSSQCNARKRLSCCLGPVTFCGLSSSGTVAKTFPCRSNKCTSFLSIPSLIILQATADFGTPSSTILKYLARSGLLRIASYRSFPIFGCGVTIGCVIFILSLCVIFLFGGVLSSSTIPFSDLYLWDTWHNSAGTNKPLDFPAVK
mmetsp:Transcript_23682/g.30808  ORF Transcript_23682/g.30808 Transcript_23682/m.30808 type:complete len:218 (-) Transcript_23682:633-1286(-)